MENLQIPDWTMELDDIRVYGITGSERSETVQTRKYELKRAARNKREMNKRNERRCESNERINDDVRRPSIPTLVETGF